jgi:hypothetical protein
MNMMGMPWIDPAALQPLRWHQLAWFVYGCIEREHVLNMKACADGWMQAFVPAVWQVRLPAAAPRTQTAATGAFLG